MDDHDRLMARFAATAAGRVSGNEPDRNELLRIKLVTLTALGDALSATPEGRETLERATRAPTAASTRFAAARIVENWNRDLAEVTYVDLASAIGRRPQRPMTMAQAWLYQPSGNQEAFAAALRLNILDGGWPTE